MKSLYILGITFLLAFPSLVYAECSNEGYTVVYVNGILTNKDEAKEDEKKLFDTFDEISNLTGVNFINGYNATHLAGVGDWIKAIQQAYVGKDEVPIDDYDLRNILLQIHSEIKTKKILLLGHSQGTFYTNALYDYLVKNGVPEESLKVYNLATPASYVGGEGEYLTSANDRLILKVRELAAAGGAKLPLEANALLPLPASEWNDPWGGHHFSSDYLAGAPQKIISEINGSLGSLVASETAKEECFSAPPQDLSFHLQKFAFGIADPLAVVAYEGGRAGYGAARFAIRNAYSGLASVFNITGVVAEDEPLPATTEVAVTNAPTKPPITPAIKEIVVLEPETVPEVAANNTAISFADSEPKFSVPSPGFGGGGAPASSPAPASPPLPEPEPESPLPEPPPAEPVPPESPVILIPSALSFFATTTVDFAGTAAAHAIISTGFSNATTSADEGGNWSISLPGFSDGEVTVNFYATDENGLVSPPAAVSISIDTAVPDAPVLAIAECDFSLVSGACTTDANQLHLSWSSVSTDISTYAIFQDGVLLGMFGGTAGVVSSVSGAHSYEVVAYDAASNAATSSPYAVEKVTLPTIGYYCPPYLTTYLEGGTYAHEGIDCHYLSANLAAAEKMGDIYKGTVGNAVIVNGHSFSANDSVQSNDGYPTATTSDQFFVAIYQLRIGPAFANDLPDFRSYFQTRANPPPHLNFGVINWVYGP